MTGQQMLVAFWALMLYAFVLWPTLFAVTVLRRRRTGPIQPSDFQWHLAVWAGTVGAWTAWIVVRTTGLPWIIVPSVAVLVGMAGRGFAFHAQRLVQPTLDRASPSDRHEES